MATICLVRPLLSATDFNGYPLNLLILGAALRNAGHNPLVKDYDFLKEVDPSWDSPKFAARAAEDILSSGCDIVGITAMCSNYVLAIDLARELKKRAPQVHITFGGPHVSLCPIETLESFPEVDTVVVGEGEITFPELVTAIEEKTDLDVVQGIGYRKEGKPKLTFPRPLMHNLTMSPRPAYDLIDMSVYLALAKDIYLQVYAGSGCPFTCTFCSTSLVWERKYRIMTVERIVDEMEYLNKTYGATYFNCIHDNLTVNKPFIHEIAKTIMERGLEIKWGFSSRIDTLDEETAQIVSKAGCNYIFFGVESGSTKIQKTMKKRLKIPMIHNAMRYCFENGILPTTSFILGFSDEDREDIESTIRLAFGCKVHGAWRSFINLLSPYTGTELMRESANLTLDWEHVNSSMVRFLYDQHFREIEKNPFIFANYYFLDYSHSYLNAADYSNLVDFFTICLFKYPYTINYLINDRGISPIDVFRHFESQIDALTPKERDEINITIQESDLFAIAGTEDTHHFLSVLRYDQSILVSSQESNIQVLYQGSVFMVDGSVDNVLEQPVVHEDLSHFLHVNRGGYIETYELEADQFQLYEKKGVPVFSVFGPSTSPTDIKQKIRKSVGGRTMLDLKLNSRDTLLKFDQQIQVYNWYYPFPDHEGTTVDPTYVLQQSKKLHGGQRALYFHFLFCDTICTFCPFYRTAHKNQAEHVERYMDAIIQEIRWKSGFEGIGKVPIDVIAVGGGTPSVLSTEQILRFGRELHERFDLSQLKEFTFEVEVKSVTYEKLKAMKSIGVNRISFGIQTFLPKYREIFNLTSTTEQIQQVVAWTTELFPYVNVDMIYGMAGQTLDEVLEDANKAIALGTTTVDFYILNNMTASLKMHKTIEQKGFPPLSAATKISYRLFLDEYMRAKGYIPINGYSYTHASGKESSPFVVTRDPIFHYHDVLYGYAEDEVIGFGSSALSQIGGYSLHNPHNTENYISSMLQGGELEIVAYDAKECPEKGVVYFPYRGVLEKDRIAWNRVPKETLEAFQQSNEI